MRQGSALSLPGIGLTNQTLRLPVGDFWPKKNPLRTTNIRLPFRYLPPLNHVNPLILRIMVQTINPLILKIRLIQIQTNSFKAWTNCSSLGAAPWNSRLFSIKETPLPLIVLAIITEGFPFVFSALAKASRTCCMS
jgi:hypothetical protein